MEPGLAERNHRPTPTALIAQLSVRVFFAPSSFSNQFTLKPVFYGQTKPLCLE
jgi:hypothetical protein